jgi:hypothetical protein
VRLFGDIEGKLDVLRVECRCRQRKGRYSIRKLLERYGRKGHMMKCGNSSAVIAHSVTRHSYTSAAT